MVIGRETRDREVASSTAGPLRRQITTLGKSSTDSVSKQFNLVSTKLNCLLTESVNDLPRIAICRRSGRGSNSRPLDEYDAYNQ